MTTTRRLSRASARRGFTLVELLVVVAMIGVLAALALVGYRKYMRSSASSEATAMIQGIRAAEEAYKAEMLVYLNISTDLTSPSSYYPRDPSVCTPGKVTKSGWGGNTGPDYALWQALNVSADSPVVFSYAVKAGTAATAMPTLHNSIGQAPAWPTPSEPWFVVQALADRDCDGVFASFAATSMSGEVTFNNEME
jgi:type IV pilus assembly protein PilA